MASSMVIAPPPEPFFSMSRDMSLSVTAAAAPSLCAISSRFKSLLRIQQTRAKHWLQSFAVLNPAIP